ncbi:MAG: GmrSD restriction endonuclease domain-containing protein [Solirubrobacterales bacterium]
MKLEYQEISVQDLVRFAQKERSIAVPEFQRPFRWDQGDAADMMRTVVRDWPSGAILLIGKGDLVEKIAVSEIRGAPAVADNHKDKVDTLILDGQQRLTSVYQAVTDSSPDFVYYVDMKEVHERDRFEDECLAWAKRDDYPESQEAANQLWASLDVLFSEKAFSEWLDRIEPKLKDRMDELYEKHLWPIRAYKFPALTLPASLDFRALVRIFDKLNRLGEPLDNFDLLVALMLPEGFKLRVQSEKAAERFAEVGNTNRVKGMEIPKLIALNETLRQRKSKKKEEDRTVNGIREDDVLDLVDADPNRLSKEWDGAVRSYAKALEFLRDECGGTHNNLLPQDAMILALAVALSQPRPRKGYRADLKRWVWASYFTQAYAQGVNTRAVSDAQELAAWAKDAEKEPTAIRRLETQPEIVDERLRDSRAGNRVFVRGLMALLVSDDAKDWLEPKKGGEPQVLAQHEGAIDFHHVFPDKFLTERGKPSEMIVNFTPLKASTNRSIGRDKPSTVLGNDRFDKDALVKHRIELAAIKDDDVEKFVDNRVPALLDLIAAETGISKIS